VYTFTVEPDGPAWLLRVVERPELVTSVPTAELDHAPDGVRDPIATSDQMPRKASRCGARDKFFVT
jgi:hypothetical protein